ncbi:MAG: SOS response-associated peptidase [Sneathiella sp.]
MCGRKYVAEGLNWQQYKEKLTLTTPPPQTNLEPNYNIAPTQTVLVCVFEEGRRLLKFLKWGLVPFWAKDQKIGAKMINARSESLEQKKSYSPLLLSHRCIVPVSGFYEWKRDGNFKQAHAIRRKDHEPLLMAGLWTENKLLEIGTYTVITRDANDVIRKIHHRMPAILHPDQVSTWLEGEWPKANSCLNDSYLGDELEVHPVSNDVGNVRNNSKYLSDPLRSLF